MPLVRPVIQALDWLIARSGRSVPRSAHLITGARGEEEAYFHLRRLGYTVVARDYRSPRRPGDIDLIAWEGETLCFVEVKTRSRRNFMPAEAAVDENKRNTLSQLAREYLRQYAHAYSRTPVCRFDVISVYLEDNDSPQIALFRDAFLMS